MSVFIHLSTFSRCSWFTLSSCWLTLSSSPLVDIRRNQPYRPLAASAVPRLLPVSLYLLKKHNTSSGVHTLAVREWWGFRLGALFVFTGVCARTGLFVEPNLRSVVSLVGCLLSSWGLSVSHCVSRCATTTWEVEVWIPGSCVTVFFFFWCVFFNEFSCSAMRAACGHLKCI